MAASRASKLKGGIMSLRMNPLYASKPPHERQMADSAKTISVGVTAPDGHRKPSPFSSTDTRS